MNKCVETHKERKEEKNVGKIKPSLLSYILEYWGIVSLCLYHYYLDCKKIPFYI